MCELDRLRHRKSPLRAEVTDSQKHHAGTPRPCPFGPIRRQSKSIRRAAARREPGQGAVFLFGESLLGGGWMNRQWSSIGWRDSFWASVASVLRWQVSNVSICRLVINAGAARRK